MTKETIQGKIDSLTEQEEQIKVMFQKIQGAKEALMALKEEMDVTKNETTTKKKSTKTK